MEYKAIYINQDDFEHSLFGKKGSQKKNHKYLMREWVNGKWKYYYTQAQINARKIGNKLARKKTLGDEIKDSAKQIKRSIDDPKNGIDPKKVKKSIDKGKKKVEKALNKFSKTKVAKKIMGKDTETTSLKTKGKNIVSNLFKEKTKSNPLSGFGIGLTNKSYAASFGQLAVSDLLKGKFKKAANEANIAVDYITSDSSSSRIKKNKVVDKLGLELRGANPEWYDGYVNLADVANANKKKKK